MPTCASCITESDDCQLVMAALSEVPVCPSCLAGMAVCSVCEEKLPPGFEVARRGKRVVCENCESADLRSMSTALGDILKGHRRRGRVHGMAKARKSSWATR